jgi:hypothetical protein
VTDQIKVNLATVISSVIVIYCICISSSEQFYYRILRAASDVTTRLFPEIRLISPEQPSKPTNLKLPSYLINTTPNQPGGHRTQISWTTDFTDSVRRPPTPSTHTPNCDWKPRCSLLLIITTVTNYHCCIIICFNVKYSTAYKHCTS